MLVFRGGISKIRFLSTRPDRSFPCPWLGESLGKTLVLLDFGSKIASQMVSHPIAPTCLQLLSHLRRWNLQFFEATTEVKRCPLQTALLEGEGNTMWAHNFTKSLDLICYKLHNWSIIPVDVSPLTIGHGSGSKWPWKRRINGGDPNH